MATRTLTDPIRLDYHANDKREVVVTPPDNDLFMMNVKDAAMACQAGWRQIEFSDQFRGVLLLRLAKWLTEHDEKVHRAFLSVREGTLLFLVVRKAVRFDSEFTDMLTALDVEIARDPELDMIRLEVLALPCVSDEDARSFLDPQSVMVFERAQ